MTLDHLPRTTATTDTATDADVLAEQQQAALLLRSLGALVAPGLDPPVPALRPGPRTLTVEAAADLVVRDHREGHRSLAHLAEALTGWRRRLSPGRVARLEARLDGRAVAASYVAEEGVLVLGVVSAPLPVTREQSRRLRGVAS